KPGMWVFPGGKVESHEHDAADERVGALRAAVRETHEEAGLRLEPSGLVTISRWITPEVSPKRFDTWFFLGVAGGEQQVQVDGGEIVDHRWVTPESALEAHHRGEARLAPPTFVTVTWLLAYRKAEEAHGALGEADLVTFRPRICPTPEGACMLYPGDAGYEAGDPGAAGARHRLWALEEGYRYERS
nr:NUDIX hydrolase [Myxococcota bacterium]